MPRIYNSAGEPIDFCGSCFPSEDEAEKYDNPSKYGLRDGVENGYGYEDTHPPYEYEDYTCEECGDLLTEEDN